MKKIRKHYFTQLLNNMYSCVYTKLRYAIQGDNVSPHKSYKLLNKKPTSLQVVGQGIKTTHKTIQAIAIALGFLPAFEAKTLLLKMPCTSDIGFGGSRLEMAWKEVSSLSFNSHNIERCYARHQVGKVISTPIQL